MTQPHWVEEYFAPPGPALLNESTGTIHNVPTTDGPARRRNHRFTGVAPTITGFASGATSRPITIFAVGGPIVLKHENTGSLAANRISTPDGSDFTLPQNAALELVYDGDSARWRVSSPGGSPGGGDGDASYPIDLTDSAEVTVPAAGLVTSSGTALGRIADGTQSYVLEMGNSGSGNVKRWALRDRPTITNTGTGTLNDVATTDANSNQAEVILWTGNGADPATITSLAGPTQSRPLVIINASAGDDPGLTLSHAAGTGTAANRIECPGNTALVIKVGYAAVLRYNSTSSRWRVVGGTALVRATELDLIDYIDDEIAGVIEALGSSTETEQEWTPTDAPGTERLARLEEFEHDGSPSEQEAWRFEIADGFLSDHIITLQCSGPGEESFRRTWRVQTLRDGDLVTEKDEANSSGDATDNEAGYDATCEVDGTDIVVNVTGEGLWSIDATRLKTQNGTRLYLRSVTPATDVPAGGASITIAGARFVATPAVTIGGTACTAEALVDSNTLTCTVPAKAAGTYDVVVTNPDTQTATRVNGFTYADPAFDPATMALTGWWRASYTGSPWTSTASAGSSSGRTATEATNPPGTSAIGAYNAADFDGGNDKLTTAGGVTEGTLFNDNALAVAILYKADTLAASAGGTPGGAIGDAGLLAGSGAYLAISINATGPKVAILDGTYKGHQRSDGNSTGTWYLLMVRISGGNLSSCLNGGSWTDTAVGTIDDVTSSVRFGCNHDATIFFDGKIAEILTSDVAWTDGDRANLVSYVNARYGLSL